MRHRLLALAVVLVTVRVATITAYRDTLYYYGMVANQFGIAEGAYRGHWFALDPGIAGAAVQTANRENRYVPIEEWKTFPPSGIYRTFPAVDLPGFGYVIAFTSRAAGGELTTRYAMAVQVAVETASVLLFAWCVGLVRGRRVGGLTGLVYALGYPFQWPIASHPMRDVFVLGSYAAGVAATLVLLRSRGARAWALALALLAAGSALLWIRPHGYYYFFCLVPLVALARGVPVRTRVAAAFALVAVPLLAFGLPLRQFNMRHYGVPQTDSVGLALWQQLGAIPDNPYGFVRRDEAMVPWVKAYHGRDVDYASPEMNRLLGEYARKVVREHPGYYLRVVGTIALEIARTPLDLVPPFRTVEYSTSGLSPAEYARAYPVAFAFKLFNRVLMALYFYGGIALAGWLLLRQPGRRLEVAILLSPFLYTLASQLLVVFNQRYMASGAWALSLPIAYAIDALLERRRAG
ncbi:MAG: hypothetical protein U0599_25550 [Vicinamibacteria bacterium]